MDKKKSVFGRAFYLEELSGAAYEKAKVGIQKRVYPDSHTVLHGVDVIQYARDNHMIFDEYGEMIQMQCSFMDILRRGVWGE